VLSTFAPQALAIAFGALGGALFFGLNLPLPWMLGAMAATIVAALVHAPITGPEKIRPYVVAVIGVALGSGFTPDTFDNLGQWAASILGLWLCIVVSGALATIFLVRVAHLDRVTALFAAMPGGMIEMMEMGRATGGDDRMIILIHTSRVVLVIAFIAIWFRLILGFEVSGTVSDAGARPGLSDLGVLLACGALGALAALCLKLPAPTFMGPMLLSAAAHMTGLSMSTPPNEVVVAAQVFLGAIVGCRFIGVPPGQMLRAFAANFGATLILLGVALVFAVGLHSALRQTTEQVLLAYAPGGLTEMSLVALSMGTDVAYIAAHHLVRIVTLLALAGPVLGVLAKQIADHE